MLDVQMPNVAGLFYPGDARALREDIEQMLQDAEYPSKTNPKAIIAPHAGYIYSGPIAAVVYAQLQQVRANINRVVVLAPSHRVSFQGIAASTAQRFNTPLGDIKVDTSAVAEATHLPQVGYLDQAFANEHAVEVQLPFLQTVLGEFQLVPFVVGEAGSKAVAELIERLWDNNETLIVVSSDLSHYLDYEHAMASDRATTKRIEALDENLEYGDACGRNPIRGLLRVAKNRGLKAEMLDLRNSGDTAGEKDRVVGYGAYVFQ